VRLSTIPPGIKQLSQMRITILLAGILSIWVTSGCYRSEFPLLTMVLRDTSTGPLVRSANASSRLTSIVSHRLSILELCIEMYCLLF
jgi:hypothetical protein